MISKKTLNALLAGAVAVTIAGAASSAAAMESHEAGEGKEKCYGVAKIGANDCASASGSHSCAGHAATDGDGGEWIALPAGVCSKLVNGSLEPVAAAPVETSAPAEEVPEEPVPTTTDAPTEH